MWSLKFGNKWEREFLINLMSTVLQTLQFNTILYLGTLSQSLKGFSMWRQWYDTKRNVPKFKLLITQKLLELRGKELNACSENLEFTKFSNLVLSTLFLLLLGISSWKRNSALSFYYCVETETTRSSPWVHGDNV